MIQPCIYRPFVDLPVWWTPFRIDILTRKLPDFNEIVPKFDRLLWISGASPCFHIYRVDRWWKVEQATEICSPYPLWLSVYRAPMQVKNVLKFQEYSILGVRLWLSRIRSDLVTAQVDLTIKLESTQNDSALYLYTVWRFGRLINPLQNRTFWPVNYQISTKLSPSLTDYCGSAVHRHAFIFTGWIGDGT